MPGEEKLVTIKGIKVGFGANVKGDNEFSKASVVPVDIGTEFGQVFNRHMKRVIVGNRGSTITIGATRHFFGSLAIP